MRLGPVSVLWLVMLGGRHRKGVRCIDAVCASPDAFLNGFARRLPISKP